MVTQVAVAVVAAEEVQPMVQLLECPVQVLRAKVTEAA
jgi:hypothetical protein